MAFTAMAYVGMAYILMALRFLQEGADSIKDLNDSDQSKFGRPRAAVDQSKFVAALALSSIKVLTVANNPGYD